MRINKITTQPGNAYSDRARPRADDCSDMRAAQRGGQPARHESVHELHALDVARGRHDLQQRTVERQRALVLCEVGSTRLAKQLRLLAAGTLRARA